MRLISYIILAAVAVFGISFACLNAEPVVIDYYVGRNTLPLSFLLVLAVMLGCVLGFFGGISFFWRCKKENRRLKRDIKLAQKEVTNLRAIPLTDDHAHG